MDLSINLTLVVQLGNFLVAYWLLTKFLWRPAYTVISNEMTAERKLKSTIVARQELIAHKQLYKVDRWRLFQDHFRKQKPSFIEEYSLAHPQESLNLPELTDQQIVILSQEISSTIKPQVVND